jgi:hypothetical protein
MFISLLKPFVIHEINETSARIRSCCLVIQTGTLLGLLNESRKSVCSLPNAVTWLTWLLRIRILVRLPAKLHSKVIPMLISTQWPNPFAILSGDGREETDEDNQFVNNYECHGIMFMDV